MSTPFPPPDCHALRREPSVRLPSEFIFLTSSLKDIQPSEEGNDIVRISMDFSYCHVSWHDGITEYTTTIPNRLQVEKECEKHLQATNSVLNQLTNTKDNSD